MNVFNPTLSSATYLFQFSPHYRVMCSI